jgi:sarcosine oxidase
MIYDVGIVGVGSMGSMALWQLAQRGVRVIGFEQFTLGHDRGAAGGETRMFRTAYQEGHAYVPLLQESRRLWRALEEETGTSLLSLNGLATIGTPDSRYVTGAMECIERFELDAEIFSADEANARYPALNVLPGEIAVLDKAAGLIKPELAVMTAGTLAESRGATLVRHAKVRAIEPDGGGVWVRTEGRDYRVGRLVLTAGAWAADFIPHDLVAPHRVSLTWFLAREPGLFTPDVFPSVNRIFAGTGISLFSSQDGTTVKTAVNGSAGAIRDPDEARTYPQFEAARLSAIVAELYPQIWPEPVRTTSYTDGFTTDEHALVGEMPGLPNVVIAAGFSAHGFKMAPAIGYAVADLVTIGETHIPVNHLSTKRIQTPSMHAA